MQLFVRAAYSPPCLISTQADASIAAVCNAYAQYQGLDGGLLRVVYEGRTLDGRSTLVEAGVTKYGTLELLPRLVGGGGDGGATGAESRSCYLEMYLGKKPDKVNPEEERLARWTTCQLSGMALTPPVVADELGNLFNKDALISALVNKAVPRALSHISSLKHVFDLRLEPNPDAKAALRFVCPITGLALGGKARFSAVRATGHVLSERALKEVPAVVEELVGFKVGPADLLPLNPPAEELAEMRERLLEARAAARAAKKEGKAAKKKNGAAAATAEGAAAAAATAAAAWGKRPAAAAGGGDAALDGSNGASNGDAAAGAGKAAKKFKAAELMPSGADKEIWNSLFTSSRAGEEKETFLCRSTAARGMHLS